MMVEHSAKIGVKGEKFMRGDLFTSHPSFNDMLRIFGVDQTPGRLHEIIPFFQPKELWSNTHYPNPLLAVLY